LAKYLLFIYIEKQRNFQKKQSFFEIKQRKKILKQRKILGYEFNNTWNWINLLDDIDFSYSFVHSWQMGLACCH
jgi:hypothetical protein